MDEIESDSLSGEHHHFETKEAYQDWLLELADYIAKRINTGSAEDHHTGSLLDEILWESVPICPYSVLEYDEPDFSSPGAESDDTHYAVKAKAAHAVEGRIKEILADDSPDWVRKLERKTSRSSPTL